MIPTKSCVSYHNASQKFTSSICQHTPKYDSLLLLTFLHSTTWNPHLNRHVLQSCESDVVKEGTQ